ncbi:hypothetical protein ACHAW5_011281 [Stephanodiscus triporus]|uniref:Uncharacterized protein n=1 Tax=Stephanodiscus triporus TaxID=2934178 RepID=A0ABD3QE07_9STRA
MARESEIASRFKIPSMTLLLDDAKHSLRLFRATATSIKTPTKIIAPRMNNRRVLEYIGTRRLADSQTRRFALSCRIVSQSDVEDILRLVHIYDRYYVLLPTGGRLLREDLYQAYELRV